MKTLVILAGGKSSRMGKDKIFLHLHDNASFLEHLYHEAAGIFDRIIISGGSKEHTRIIQQLLPEAELVEDLYPEKGPMGGLVSVYEQTGAEKFAVIPVDVPGADMHILGFFFEQCTEGACVLKDGDFPEPLIGAYGTHMLEKLKHMLRQGDFRMYAALSAETKFYSFSELKERIPEKTEADLRRSFQNINTEEDYRNYLK